MDERELSQSDLAAAIWDRYENTEGKKNGRWQRSDLGKDPRQSFYDTTNLAKLAKALDVKVSDLALTTLMKAAHHGASPTGRSPGRMERKATACSCSSRCICLGGHGARHPGAFVAGRTSITGA